MQRTQLYVRVRVGILSTRGEHLHDHIILLKCVFWAHKTSFNPPLFIEVPVSNGIEQCVRMCAAFGLSNSHAGQGQINLV
jgi:hypothetical protein